MPYPSIEEITQTQIMLSHMRYANWINESLFTYQWWIMLTTLIIPWIIWWKLVDKKRVFQILFLGLMVLLTATVFDGIGTELGFWDCPKKLAPILPRLLDVDFGVLPIVYMLIYQYFPKWTPFIITMVIGSLLMAYVAEPALIWLKIYQPLTWKHFYSVPIYILIGIAFKALTDYLAVKTTGPLNR